MGNDKQQQPQVQAYPQLEEAGSMKTISTPFRGLRGSKSSNWDAEQPGTPMRVSSSSRTSGTLTTQYSEDDEYTDEPLAVVESLPRFATGVLAKQQQLQEQQHGHDVQFTAARQAAAVVVACVVWVMISSATILINKHIMVDLSFPFPAAVSALGMLGTTVASFLVCAVFKVVPCKVSITPYFFFTRIMTTGFLIALSFQAGNTAYLYLSVAFVQMLKAFTPVSTMLSGFAFGLEKPSAKLIAAVGCISCGVLVSSYGEVNFSAFGVAAMLLSIAAEGLRTVLMQHLLSSKQFHPLEAWMYLGPACIVWLFVLIGVVEAQQIQDQQALSIMLAHKWYFGFAALAGFAVNALAMLVIKLASALTLKVLGVCKDVGLVTFGVLLLGEHVAGLQVGGYAIALCGFAAYNYIKMASPQALTLPRQADGNNKKAGPLERQHSTVYISSSKGSDSSSSSNNTVSSLSRASSIHPPAQQQQQSCASYRVYQHSSCLTEPLLPPSVLVCSKVC